VSVKKKKEVEETCVQVKGFFNGDVEKDLQILVNAVWFLCLLSCLAVERRRRRSLAGFVACARLTRVASQRVTL